MGAPFNRVELRSTTLDLTLIPALGGAVAGFHCTLDGRRWPVLRSSDGVPGHVLDAASLPLVPFCNRVRSGRFGFRSREVEMAANLPGDPNPLHGQGWLAAWDVVEARTDEAELVYRHPAGEWPWTYEARQHVRLDEASVSLVLSCRNLAAEPMPCGLGQHPYFPCTERTRLDTGVTHVWTIDEHMLPIEQVLAEGRYGLSDRPICGQALDNGFAGWNGRARISDPGLPFAIELSSPDAGFFQVYSPPTGGFFAAEPVSHANAALNEPETRWPELGLRVLQPGETMSLRMRIDVRPSGRGSPAS